MLFIVALSNYRCCQLSAYRSPCEPTIEFVSHTDVIRLVKSEFYVLTQLPFKGNQFSSPTKESSWTETELKFNSKYTKVTPCSFVNAGCSTISISKETLEDSWPLVPKNLVLRTIVLTREETGDEEGRLPLFGRTIDAPSRVNWQSDNLRVTIKTWHCKSSSWHVRGAWPIGH